MDLPQKIEALLFFKAEPVSVSWLARALAVSEGEVWEGLAELEKLLAGRGICVIQKDDTAVLGTAPGASELVEKTLKEDLERTLGAAALEALAIIAYKGPIAPILHQLVGGVRASMGYLGAPTIPDLQKRARFVKITNAGLRESHVHDVQITREAPNYPSRS